MSTPEKTKLALPTIHLNGTSADSLKEGWERAYAALNAARGALCAASPNMRDFYVQKNAEENFARAKDQHFNRLQKLEDIEKELVSLCEGVDAQVSEREKLRGGRSYA